MTNCKIHLVLLNWNAIIATVACLKRLMTWTTIQPAIWVVDNASTDDSIAILSEKFPSVHFIQSEVNLGFSGGNNLALHQIVSKISKYPGNRASSVHYVLLLNNDAFIDEENVQCLIDVLGNDTHIGVVGPLFTDKNSPDCIVSAGGRDLGRYIDSHIQGNQIDPDLLKSGQPYSVDYVSGTVALLRVEVLKEIGFFDEAYFFSGEMADLCERIKMKGYDCAITPRAKAYHDTSQASGLRNNLYAYYILRNRFLFIRKFRRQQQRQLFAFWIAYGMAFILKAILCGEWSTVHATRLALKDGVTGTYGGQNKRVSERVKG